MPEGMFSQSTVTSVPFSVSAKVIVIFISPANLGSRDFEFDEFHDLLVRDQLDKSSLERISVRGALADQRMF
jgi:hypothetical protein